MGICYSPVIFQKYISEIFQVFFMVRAYIDDVLVIPRNNSKEHPKELDRVLQRLAEAGLKVNADFFNQTNRNRISWFLSNQ